MFNSKKILRYSRYSRVLVMFCAALFITNGCSRPKNDTQQNNVSNLFSIASKKSFSNPAEAIHYYNLVLKRAYPDSRLYHLSKMGIASSYAKIGSYEDAIDNIRDLLLKSTNIKKEFDLVANINLNALYSNEKDIDKIVAAYKKVLQKHPTEIKECYLAFVKTIFLHKSYVRYQMREKMALKERNRVKNMGLSEKEKINYLKAKNDIEANLPLALDVYEIDNGTYPSTRQGLQALKDKPLPEPIPAEWKGPYVKRKDFKDPWGNDYVYVCPGNHNKTGFDLYSKGKDGIGDGTDIDDINNWRL